MEYKTLSAKGANLSIDELEKYLEKMASNHILKEQANINTYPIPKLKENFNFILQVYNLLNEHIKLGIPIHPAGEWLLDNFYIIEETKKNIIKGLSLKEYKNFIAIANGEHKGFARIYAVCSQIVIYTDYRINAKTVVNLISSYQKKKTLNMEEIWNIGLFMQIALIHGIREICEKIYLSQMQKYRVENIVERLVENKENLKFKNLSNYKEKVKGYGEMKYPFIEYMSFVLKKYGKAGIAYINALEEQVNKMGTNIDEVIKKEHFDIALNRVSMANAITSIKEISRIDFKEIFDKINGVEDILRKDPAGIYENMDYKTKEYYRNTIKEISKKTKTSEIYIANTVLNLCQVENGSIPNTSHVGYYLIGDGLSKLYEKIEYKPNFRFKIETKVNLYIFGIWGLTIILNFLVTYAFYMQLNNIVSSIILFLLLLIPNQQIANKIIQYILGKIIKPKLIPKMNFENKIPEEYSTFVVIPTILNSKEKVKELMEKLEVYYLANKVDNLYFALLGDCTSGKNKEEKFDLEVEEEGIKEVKRLNKKYGVSENQFPKFSFIYRKRFWNGKEECYLGWERKRGFLNQFNDYLLEKDKNFFKVNTIEDWKKKGGLLKEEENKIPKIKYIITLDSDTCLTLNSATELIGAMAHILNTPILNDNKDEVIKGHALMQPRVGINLENARKNLFTKIYAGSGGTDPYVNAISDIYEDIFDEGIFTGKGIYDLEVFSTVLKNEIPENKVLSHDLLEGSYLRAGLTTDILLMDGYPTNYNSYKSREHRWLRGDFQIIGWLKKYIIDKNENKKINPLNKLSKYKIFDNLIRGIFPISTLLAIIYLSLINKFYNVDTNTFLIITLLAVSAPTVIDIIDKIIYYKNGKKFRKYFEPGINEFLASLIRGFLSIAVLPDKAYSNLNAILKTLYRLIVSKKHMLEWITSEDSEKLSKTDLKSYYITMFPNVVLGILGIILVANTTTHVLSILWLLTPLFMWHISKKEKKIEQISKLNLEEKEYIFNIGKKTWDYFKDTLNEQNNYLPPDNYQEDRRQKEAKRTSPTNIGLAILTVISSYDLAYEKIETVLQLLQNMLNTIEKLPKWNGHLYNWYNIETLEPLIPRYISVVDSGNFIGYVYVLKQFYIEIKQKIEDKKLDESLLKYIPNWIEKGLDEIPFTRANFSKLYDYEKQLFTIGFNIEENKLTNSYYDLLASEARCASLVAIAKKDIEPKHWYNLGRALTTLKEYKGLVSWSGTAFEYLMPNIIIKKYKGSLLDESCKFMIMSQKEYAKKLRVPWGFSETAYNIKDLNGNYQYKAIGIPWLGLKRGLEDDITVSTYGSVMAITDDPRGVIKNLKKLESQNMYGKYGFYESIDYTPERLSKGKKYEPIKTYMAHHEALILISINNLFLNNIMQKRFMKNEEIQAVDILLQERVPKDIIITKEQKVKPSKIKYTNYENYEQRVYNKPNQILDTINVIASNDYSVIMNQKGEGYSKYKDIFINRYKVNSDEEQGIFFYLKNIKTKRIWTANFLNYSPKADKSEVRFADDIDEFIRIDGNIQTKLKVTIDALNPVEIRNLSLKNLGLEVERLEVTSYLEPILSKVKQDYMHPAFNNLFLSFEYLKDENILIVKRRKRGLNEKENFVAVALIVENNKSIGELEYEIDKEKFVGRGNLNLPIMVQNSKPFSNKINLVTDPIIALKRTIDIKPEEEINVNYILAVGETKEEVVKRIKKYDSNEMVQNAFEVSKAKVDAESRYLRLKAKDIQTYQKMLSYLIYPNLLQLKLKENNEKNIYPQSELWKYGISGDLPILLFKIRNSSDEYIFKDLLKAYEYFKIKNIDIDLVIINEEPNNYENYLKQVINNQILSKGLNYMQNVRGGIFVIDNETNDLKILEFWSSLILDSKLRPNK